MAAAFFAGRLSAVGIRSVIASPETRVRFLGGALEPDFFLVGPDLETGFFFVRASETGAFIAGGSGLARDLGSAQTQAGIWVLAGRAMSVNVSTKPSANETAISHQCT